MFDVTIKPSFIVGVARYCFRWNAQAFAEGDVIADCLCVFVNVGCGLLKHSPISAFKKPVSVSTAFTDQLFHSFHGWFNTLVGCKSTQGKRWHGPRGRVVREGWNNRRLWWLYNSGQKFYHPLLHM